jgi:hypothetical protein
MRERLIVLGVVGLLGISPTVGAYEDSTTAPVAEGTSAPAPSAPAPASAPVRSPAAKPQAATVKAPRAATPGAGAATRPPAQPLRLTLDADQRLAKTPPAAATKGDAEPAPPNSAPVADQGRAGDAAGAREPVTKRNPPLKLAPSAREIEGERQTVLKPKVETRPDRYENQSPDVPAPTQVRRVPGPGSGVGSTAAERKATMLENSGPQQNSTYRRW